MRSIPHRAHARQDMKNVKAFARAAGCELPVIERVPDRCERNASEGDEMADSVLIARLYDRRG